MNKEALAITASMFFSCGFVYGATIKVHTWEELERRFHSFNQEDADAIARHCLKETKYYLQQVIEDKKDIFVLPKKL